MSPARPSPDGDPQTTSDSDAAQRTPRADEEHVWDDIRLRWSELWEYAGYLLAANVDRYRLTARAAVMWSMLGVIVALSAAALLAAASVLLVLGASTGLGQLLGGRIWLGQLIVGGAILATATGGTWFVLRRSFRAYQRRLIESYERRKQNERAEYGTDVQQRAQAKTPATGPAIG